MNKPDYIVGIAGAERRFLHSPVKVLKRDDSVDDAPASEIEGVAARVGEIVDLGWFSEVIEPGAFDQVLADDVRCLWNHDPSLVLARSSTDTKTLQLFLDSAGHLSFRYATPNRSYAKDLEDAILSGDVNQCSFSFTIADAEWKLVDGKDVRSIKRIEKLYDVGPVTFPANPDTTVAKRSLETIHAERRNHEAYRLKNAERQLLLHNRKS